MLVMQPLLRRLTEIVIHCHRLLGLARNPYRPELHYMRGPGPKWRAKHARNERRTWFVAALTAVMMVGEIVAGSLFGSMALLADGWHMASHVSALGIAAAGITAIDENRLAGDAAEVHAQVVRKPPIEAAVQAGVKRASKTVRGITGLHVIEQKTAVTPLVEVRDRNGQPVAGAVVRFTIRQGRASFNGARALTVTTNAAGRATANGFAPTGSGALQISTGTNADLSIVGTGNALSALGLTGVSPSNARLPASAPINRGPAAAPQRAARGLRAGRRLA